jgi:hypothetical protein
VPGWSLVWWHFDRVGAAGSGDAVKGLAFIASFAFLSINPIT